MFARFLDFLFPVRTDEEIVREMTLEQFLSHLEPLLEERTSPAAVALFPFADRKVRAVIHEAKYHGNAKAFDFLSAALVEYLRDAEETSEFGHPLFEGHQISLIPIPLGAKRRKGRGFNQVEEVARRASKELDVVLVTNLLIRTRETASQVSLPRAARAKNMRGAFSTTRRADPNHTYIVIDDVTTTGATLSAALSALKSAGALTILPIALAH
ncbi:MAG: hypothetical protein Q7R54_01255 [bacterium]|nr:hypothetical protein [bacterium]